MVFELEAGRYEPHDQSSGIQIDGFIIMKVYYILWLPEKPQKCTILAVMCNPKKLHNTSANLAFLGVLQSAY
jgi:hypothetical protein